MIEKEELIEALLPIANSSTSTEYTDMPLWWILNPEIAEITETEQIYYLFNGPFWSRESADLFLKQNQHHFCSKAIVWCGGAKFKSPDVAKLYKISQQLAEKEIYAKPSFLEGKGLSSLPPAVVELLKAIAEMVKDGVGGFEYQLNYPLSDWVIIGDELEKRTLFNLIADKIADAPICCAEGWSIYLPLSDWISIASDLSGLGD
jgi:hypothetical protein